MQPATLAKIKQMEIKKGDVLSVARVAGIMAAKKTPDLIPLCHTLLITEGVTVDFDYVARRLYPRHLERSNATGQTGVEMEALTAASVELPDHL